MVRPPPVLDLVFYVFGLSSGLYRDMLWFVFLLVSCPVLYVYPD